MTKHILVTGGCGFIGSNFIRYVLEKYSAYKIINLDKVTYAGNLANLKGVDHLPNYQFIKGDIGDKELVERLFKEYKIDVVVHFAAESHVDRSILDPEAFIKTNILGTFNLLEMARKLWLEGLTGNHSPLFLHISTDEVYGTLGINDPPFTEEDPYAPNSPYAATKAASDYLVRAYHQTYGLPTIITNCSNNYGPYQFPEKLIPLVIYRAYKGKTIPIYGQGHNIRDWLYVKDHCHALDLVLHHGKSGENYNMGAKNEWRNIDIVYLICNLLDKKYPSKIHGIESFKELITFVKDRPGHDFRYAMDATKIKTELGWEPEYTFEKGIEETIDWYLNHMDWVEGIISGDYQKFFEKYYGMTL